MVTVSQPLLEAQGNFPLLELESGRAPGGKTQESIWYSQRLDPLGIFIAQTYIEPPAILQLQYKMVLPILVQIQASLLDFYSQ